MIRLLSFAVCCIIIKVSADECTSYKTLIEDHRSTLAVPTGTDRLLCDRALPLDWYRFTNGDMPTSCVPTYHCGTQIPIWLNGQLPTVQGTIVSLQACFNYGQGVNPAAYGGSTCCHASKQIQVKNCGSFNVYHLPRTPGCPMAYCAGNKPVCKRGQSSIGSANCTDLYPRMTHVPILGKPIIVDAQGHVGSTCSTTGNVKFPCHIPYPKGEPDVSFEVTWISNGHDPIMITGTQTPVVTTLNGDDRDALLDGRYMKGHMGTTLQCTVRSYHTSTPGLKSSSLKSNEFWAGIQVHNNSITVDEKGPEQDVTVESTVPITCNSPFQQTCQIGVEMKASTDPNDVSTTSCTYQLTCDPATQTYKSTIKVTATRDFVKDGDQRHELAFRPISNPISNPMWDGYSVKPIQIRSIDQPHGKCSTSGDPHVYQIDGSRNIAVNEIGDFIFYKSLARPFEVQIRTWGCGHFNPCICSVIAREGNDVVEVDMCAKRLNQIAAPHLSHWPLAGTTVDKDSTGKRLDINFPSGAHLIVRAASYNPNRKETDGFLTLNLQVPTDDLGKSVGLCGKYDNNQNNDLVGANGYKYSTNTKEKFVHTWLVNPGSSMFDQKPAYSPSAAINNTNYCQCDHHRADCTKTKANNPLAHQCGNLACTNVASHGVHPRDLDYPVESRSQREIRQVYKRTITSFPTPSGMTEAMAIKSCTDAIRGSTLYSRCQSVVLSETVNYYIDACVMDMMYSDSDVFNVAHMNTFDFECQDTVLRNVSNYAKGSHGERILPPDVTSHVCPNQCSRRGTCHEGTCVCHTGYTGNDCSVPVGVAPVASHIRGDGLCDVKDRHCMKVQVIARHLMDGPGLKCRYKKAEIGNGVILPYGPYIDAPAFLTSFLEVECSLPESAVLTKDSVREAFVVSVASDGVLYSSDLTFLVYDGLCQICDISGKCTLKDNACLIENACHRVGEQSSDGGYCDPNTDPYSWTRSTVVSVISGFYKMT
ncbi:von Willebrand factor D and EGF domain-containing protein [Mizuhopecten yessoensis]|uniref:von Willebrand factor D and EGF domain-containing protein n=1 Tax=Mizuhopecten yessoensis TaxID=6573 RepID=A0A210PSP2_MIZYE|nr:von Willebrand factor D and EGF domain-containing protein [Mizuhopecten yessoensis]